MLSSSVHVISEAQSAESSEALVRCHFPLSGGPQRVVLLRCFFLSDFKPSYALQSRLVVRPPARRELSCDSGQTRI